MGKTTTLFRPVGTKELELISQSEFTVFPPRLPEQPIFYPVLSESYAIQIARDWNARLNEDRAGFVTKFEAKTNFLEGYETQVVGGTEHTEYWIPAEDLEDFNSNIVGRIEVIREFRNGQ